MDSLSSADTRKRAANPEQHRGKQPSAAVYACSGLSRGQPPWAVILRPANHLRVGKEPTYVRSFTA